MKKALTTLIIFASLFYLDLASMQPGFCKNKTETHEKNTVLYLNTEWWEGFNDPVLSLYMDKVFSNNHDLKIAHLKIKEGEQIVKQSIADELPSIQLAGNVERVLRASEEQFGKDMIIPPFSQTNLSFPFTASYEIDIWGINRTKTKSLKKQLDIVKEQEHAAFLSVSSNFAASYYNLVKCDKNITIQNELISLQKTMLDLISKKFEAGKCSVSDVIKEEKTLKYFEEELNVLLKERKILENELKTVMADSEIQNIPNTKDTVLPNIPTPSQLTSDVIEKRPDYIMAEENLKRAGLDVKVAKKNLLPRIVLFGQAGFNAYEFKNLFNAKSMLASFGIAPIVDIFSGGRKMAFLKFNKYKYEEAVETYQNTILTSLKEVNDSLETAKTNKKNLTNANQRLTLESRNFDIAAKKFDAGYGTKPEVIQAREIYLISQKEKTDYEINSLISAIGLHKTTGGVNLFKLENI